MVLKQCSYVILNDRLALKYESVKMTQYSRTYLLSAAEKLSAFQKQSWAEAGTWKWSMTLDCRFVCLSVFSHILSAAASFILSFCGVFISSSYLLHVYLQAVVKKNGLKLAKFPRVLVYWWISSISVWMPRCLVNVTANVECVKLNLKYSHWLLMPVIICCLRISLCYSTVWQTLIVIFL